MRSFGSATVLDVRCHATTTLEAMPLWIELRISPASTSQSRSLVEARIDKSLKVVLSTLPNHPTKGSRDPGISV